MNKLAFTAKTLSLIAVASLMACAGNAPEAASADKDDAAETVAPAKESLNIRYIDADSISAHYTLAQEFQELTLASMNKIESTGQARQNDIAKLAQQIDSKGRNNGYLTQESYEADMASLQKKQQDAAKVIDDMQRRAQQEMAQRQVELNDSLESFIKAYNAKKGYDAILFKAAGIYFNPSLDITKEVIDGLNARYEKSKKSK